MLKLLLDTHVFIWWDSDPDKLSDTAMDLLTNPQNQKILSVASIWKMQIKLSLGKLRLNYPLEQIIQNQVELNYFQILDILTNHVFALKNLPEDHKDPFDRILIA